MNPLFALRALTSHIKHVYPDPLALVRVVKEAAVDIRKLTHAEPCFSDPHALLSSPQDIGLIWHISRSTDAEYIVEEAWRR